MLHHLSDGEGFSSEKAVKTWNMQPIRGTTDVSWTQKTKQSLWIPHDPSVQARGWPLTFSKAEWWHQKEPEGFNLTRSSSEILLLDR